MGKTFQTTDNWRFGNGRMWSFRMKTALCSRNKKSRKVCLERFQQPNILQFGRKKSIMAWTAISVDGKSDSRYPGDIWMRHWNLNSYPFYMDNLPPSYKRYAGKYPGILKPETVAMPIKSKFFTRGQPTPLTWTFLGICGLKWKEHFKEEDTPFPPIMWMKPW